MGVSGTAQGTGGSRAASKRVAPTPVPARPGAQKQLAVLKPTTWSLPPAAAQDSLPAALQNQLLSFIASLRTGTFSLKFCLLQSYHFTKICEFHKEFTLVLFPEQI